MWEKLKIMGSSVWTFLLPFVRQMITQSGQILANVALQAVRDAMARGGTGADKRMFAFDKIVEDLKKQGIEAGKDIGISLINAAIEIAVQRVKGV